MKTAFLIGKKLGMTQIFADDGTVVPVSVVEAGPCVVVQVKNDTGDGYSAVQIGFGTAKHPTKAQVGHMAKSKASSMFLREMRVVKSDQGIPKVGSKLDVSTFEGVSDVTISGTSKGKGFAGVIKRHNFHRGPESHGSDHHRKPGSIGSMFPQRVMKGRKLPGHMGAARITTAGLKLVSIDAKNNLLFIGGAVPGSSGSLVEIRGLRP